MCLSVSCYGAGLESGAYAHDLYPFDTAVKRSQFQQLTQTLRCLVCQNQTLADSDALLAIQLRKRIYQQLKSGRSPDQIRAYFVARYGHFIQFRPPFDAMTWLLWLGPLVLLITSCIGVGGWFYSKRRSIRDVKIP